jgi:hypothetical protein
MEKVKIGDSLLGNSRVHMEKTNGGVDRKRSEE